MDCDIAPEASRPVMLTHENELIANKTDRRVLSHNESQRKWLIFALGRASNVFSIES